MVSLQCDGDWDHGEAQNRTLDKSGLDLLRFSFKNCAEDAGFNEHSYGIGRRNAQTSGDGLDDLEEDFKGFGGPFKLEEMIRAFSMAVGTANSYQPERTIDKKQSVCVETPGASRTRGSVGHIRIETE